MPPSISRPLKQLLIDKSLSLLARAAPWIGASRFWELRYRLGGSSGAGSYGDEAIRKAEFLNAFFDEKRIQSTIEFGCGDGAQLELLRVPQYLGLDISSTVIDRCRERYRGDPSKSFQHIDDKRDGVFDVALSLDVIYHLVEDDIYDRYLDSLFSVGAPWVVAYTSNVEAPVRTSPHVLHRAFVRDVLERFPHYQWILGSNVAESPLSATFFVFRRA